MAGTDFIGAAQLGLSLGMHCTSDELLVSNKSAATVHKVIFTPRLILLRDAICAHPFHSISGQALPEIFFTSDAVLHIDGEWPDLDCELEEVSVVQRVQRCEESPRPLGITVILQEGKHENSQILKVD